LCPLLCVRRIKGGWRGFANKGNFHLYVHPIEASSMVMAFHTLIQSQKTFDFVHFPLKAIPGTSEFKYSGGLLNNLNKDMNLLTCYYLLIPLVAVASLQGPSEGEKSTRISWIYSNIRWFSQTNYQSSKTVIRK